MENKRKIQYFEIGIYIFVSLIAIALPLFMKFENGREWNFIFKEWAKLIPLFLIFILNNFLLAPKLLFKNQFFFYIIACIFLLLTVGFLDNLLIKPNFYELRDHAHNRINSSQVEKNISTEIALPEREDVKHIVTRNRPLPPRRYSVNYGVLMIGLLIIGFNSGVKVFVKWINDQDERSDKEKQYLSTELAFLKHQVSPHFFMNTLNNIHALVDIDSEKAKDSLIKLSRLMRYLLYESDTDKVPLNKEIDFIESYIELVRLRYDEDKLSIHMHYNDNIESVFVPSLLFLPLIENAFKHGIQNGKKSFVNIQFKLKDDNLILTVKNSNFPKKNTEMNKASGIGLENIKKRLNLLYKKNYILLINSNEEVFEVSLALPI